MGADFSTALKGITPQAKLRYQQFQDKAANIWEKATAFAAQQAFTSSLNEAEALSQFRHALQQLQSVSDHLVVIGTGGASLGAYALCALSDRADHVHFIRNCDAKTIRNLINILPLERTSFLVVSKSGGTVETLAGILAIKAHFKTQGISLSQRVVAITQQNNSQLRELAASQQWTILNHPENLGGRFSVFSAVGMLPLAFASQEIEALIAKVDERFMHHLRHQPEDLFHSASWFAASLPEQPMHVLFAYGDRLSALSQWYMQLWAESLGKDLKGPTPVTAIGAIDQHSQLQLYLGGPRDKLFTILLPSHHDETLLLGESEVEALAYLHGQSMQQIMQVNAQATIDTLRHHKIPLRVFAQDFDVTNTAMFMLDYMMETLLVAVMLDIDPFTQPTVEEGKERARTLLKSH